MSFNQGIFLGIITDLTPHKGTPAGCLDTRETFPRLCQTFMHFFIVALVKTTNFKAKSLRIGIHINYQKMKLSRNPEYKKSTLLFSCR